MVKGAWWDLPVHQDRRDQPVTMEEVEVEAVMLTPVGEFQDHRVLLALPVPLASEVQLM